MKKTFIEEKSRQTPILEETDAIVAGGGVAGIVAAIAAARNGARTILVEANGFLGGTATAVPMPWIGGYVPEIHKGIIKELLDKLEMNGGLGRRFFNPINNGFLVEIKVDVFKWVSLRMLEEAGANLLLHAWIADSIVENNRLKGIIIESKSGRQALLSKVIIDATGDGDVAARAGAAWQQGRESDGKTQGMTLVGPVMENTNNDELWRFLREYKKNHPKDIADFIEDRLPLFVASGFTGLLKTARAKGDLYLDYDTIWINGTLGTDRAEIGGSFVAGVDGTNVRDLTFAEVESAKQLASLVGFAKKYIPGFANSRRTDRGSVSIGVRETRRVIGEYIFTEEDALKSRRFDDVIAKNRAPMDMHNPEGQNYTTLKDDYDVPYRCLVPEKTDNLLVAGRCISVTHKALASVRFMPCCMATGQACGTAAALAVKTNTIPRRINIGELQAALRQQGVVI
ncbi:MAG: FAD-dependent oxidoreductase [Kiritimatiellae bacterium]|nr:FAD-dependent oxidoreductase [Kiritimatiellia bacterium]